MTQPVRTDSNRNWRWWGAIASLLSTAAAGLLAATVVIIIGGPAAWILATIVAVGMMLMVVTGLSWLIAFAQLMLVAIALFDGEPNAITLTAAGICCFLCGEAARVSQATRRTPVVDQAVWSRLLGDIGLVCVISLLIAALGTLTGSLQLNNVVLGIVLLVLAVASIAVAQTLSRASKLASQ